MVDPKQKINHNRTPGVFKEEFRGDEMICLNPKNYYCFVQDGKDKLSCKGVSRNQNRNLLTIDKFKEVIEERKSLNATNYGIKLDKKSQIVMTYSMNKRGLSYFYNKRVVLNDGIHTKTLDL